MPINTHHRLSVPFVIVKTNKDIDFVACLRPFRKFTRIQLAVSELALRHSERDGPSSQGRRIQERGWELGRKPEES